MSTTTKLISGLKQDALALGLDALGVTSADSIADAEPALREFVDAKYHGSMNWMAETMARRGHPRKLWPEARSIIVVAMNYGPETDPMLALRQPSKGVISVYARHRDYHDVIKGRLKTLAAKLVSRARQNQLDCDVKVFVDTAPVMEKPLAQQAGIGWQGKHTNLVSRNFGSWLFLGSIFTTLDLAQTSSHDDHCGQCSNCLDICPTDAFPAPYKLDARRCISYLTIEHKDPIPEEFRRPMGNRIYGCDDCLAVCPWNKFARQAQEAKLASPEQPTENSLEYFLRLDDQAFRQRFSGSPVKRIGRDRFIRNCLIAAGNSNQCELLPAIDDLLLDPDPVVRDAAQWASRELKEAHP